MTASGSAATPRAAIVGCEGLRLTDGERALFAQTSPLGLILFARNVDNPAQVAALVDEFREVVGRGDAPVLIDQEGGRVQRLRPPHWWQAPAAARIGDLARRNRRAGERAAYLLGRGLAADLAPLGITVDCAPVADVAARETHAVIGDRAFGDDPALVAALGAAVADGLAAGGVAPVVKHVPGHGRARADSHAELPVVDAGLDDLRARDFKPFAALSRLPWAMTAHIAYTALDPERPATQSIKVVGEIIRGEIGFDGVLVSDDIGMSALSGPMVERASKALEAGCDLVLHCSGRLDEMTPLLAAMPALAASARRRLAASDAWVSARRAHDGFDAEEGRLELAALLA